MTTKITPAQHKALALAAESSLGMVSAGDYGVRSDTLRALARAGYVTLTAGSARRGPYTHRTYGWVTATITEAGRTAVTA